MRDDVVAIGEDPDGIHLGVCGKAGNEPLESLQSILNARIVLTELAGIDEAEWRRISGFETLQERSHHVLLVLRAQALSWCSRAPESEQTENHGANTGGLMGAP